MMIKNLWGAPRGERGQVLIFFVVIFTVILIIGTIVVDVGSFVSDRRTAQKDADAAVYAGAQPLLHERGEPNMESNALARLTEWALRNGVIDASLVIDPQIVQQCWSEPAYDGLPDGIETAIDADSTLLIGRALVDIFGDPLNVEVGAFARACVGSLVTTTGLRPWAMPMVGEMLDDGTCSAGSRLIDGQCVANCFETDALGNIMPSFGAECRIRSDEPQSVGSINLNPSDSTDAPCPGGSSSANVYETNIVEGSPAQCSIGDVVNTRQGLATGPTLDALRDLIATERACDERYNDPPPGAVDLGNGVNGVWIDDFWEAFTPADAVPGPTTVYTRRECDEEVQGVHTPRFVTVAVVHQLPTSSGTQPVEIISFAGFFVEKCERLDNDGNYVASDPVREAKCDLPPPRARFQIVGRFIQYQDLGGVGGPLNPFGTNVILLVE
jgi:hypothetical protein